jgi:drug/metabolite transporter (DMT)-like permease
LRSNQKNYLAISQALLAAALFGMSAPFSKLLLTHLSPYLLSSMLYLGAGFGMLLIDGSKRIMKINQKEANLTKNELKYIIGMILLDIAAPILLLLGLSTTNAATTSLLNNFEIVATSIIALIVFKEAIGKRIWISISLIILSSILLSISDIKHFSISTGAIFIILAASCWGIENNCTRKLSIKSPLQIVIIKGLGSGFGALMIAIAIQELNYTLSSILLALLLGFFAYGLSIFFYVTAQRSLGAARTSTYYAVAPFIGVFISLVIFSDSIKLNFIIAVLIMVMGTYFAVIERHNHKHRHFHLEHVHKHNHHDGHHNHTHLDKVVGEHTHIHIHEELEHSHEHTPDIHHNHEHQ